MSPCAFKFSLAPFFPFRPNPIRISEKKKCDSHCWHSHCCRTFFAPMSHRTAGIRTFDIRTLVSFALLAPSHCWHSHCWLRTGVVRTSVFRTLVVQAALSPMVLVISASSRCAWAIGSEVIALSSDRHKSTKPQQSLRLAIPPVMTWRGLASPSALV